MADSTLPIGSAIDLTPPSESHGTWLEQVHRWVTTVDHKKIGLMYIGYAVIFLLVGGFEAILLRIQLMVPHNNFLAPEVFNRHLHHAWHDHGLPYGDAVDHRLCQLPGSSDGRRQGYGLSPDECLQPSG